MLNSISRLGETRPEQEWSNGTEFSGYSDFPGKRVHSIFGNFSRNFYRSIQVRTGNLGIFGRMESAPEFGYFLCSFIMVAPRALVFQPLVKGNEALGTRLIRRQ